MDPAADDRACVNVIQKDDPYCQQILHKSSKCAFYEFDKVKSQWKSTNIEGPFYLYKRSKNPFYGFIIISTKNSRNMKQEINTQLQFHLNSKFLLYKIDNDPVLSLWFQEEDDCKRIHAAVQNIMNELNEKSTSVDIASQSLNPPMQWKSSLSAGDSRPPSEAVMDFSTMLKQRFQEQMKMAGNASSPTPLSTLFGQVNKNGLDNVVSSNSHRLASPSTSMYVEDFEKLVLGQSVQDSTSSSGTTQGKGVKEELVPPHMVVDDNQPSPVNDSRDSQRSFDTSSLALNKEQLRAALIGMLEDDDDFIDRIHTKYLDVMRKITQPEKISRKL